ncbi:Sigma factor SigB regulation protein RsbQ [Streptomyces sp. S4.7]|uniref:alpha/beta fold hydrolase n=1 Tax=Streptomyces sp. S4.7 TaxID=2705439 RepID=UPI0013973EB0|nr:alpha/beta hydrolase [Streptomyces sp. S4.7]QHY94259.1 Sigma factor SigB regulation protein RsbQ [Streptomyces sp. S4.7]
MTVRSRNHVTVSGRAGGPVVMLANGFGCDQNMWRLVVPPLERDFTVVLFDHVGAGRSDLSAWSRERYSTLEGYTEDVLEICHELALGPVTFVGHSVAAMMGVLAAAREPEIFAGLVLLAPSPCFIDDPDAGYRGGFSAEDIDELLGSLEANYLGWSGAMAPVIMGNPGRPELGEELTNSFCRTDPEIARVFARVTFMSDNRENLAHVTVPTLVAQCSNDSIAPPEVGDFVRSKIAGSRLITLNATGHCPQLAAPEETAAAITEFVTAER